MSVAGAYLEGLWSAPDAWASEYETFEFLHGLVRLLKPLIVLETGCYKGHSTAAIAKALSANKQGILFSCDTNPERVAEAQKAVSGFYTACRKPAAIISECTGEDLIRDVQNVDLAFLDSSGDRVAEAKGLRLSDRGIVVLHDARRDTYKEILEALHWQSVFVDTPRGLAIMQP